MDDARSGQALTPEELFSEIADEVYRDGAVETCEKQLLLALYAYLGLSHDRAQELLKASRDRFRDGALGEPRPFDPAQVHRRLVELVARDRRLDPGEIKLLERISGALRIPADRQQAVLDEVMGRKA